MRVAQHSHGTASPSHISFSHFCLLPQTTRQSQRGWDFSCQAWDWDWIHFWDSILWKRLKARDRATKFWLLCERHLFFSQRKGQITHCLKLLCRQLRLPYFGLGDSPWRATNDRVAWQRSGSPWDLEHLGGLVALGDLVDPETQQTKQA